MMRRDWRKENCAALLLSSSKWRLRGCTDSIGRVSGAGASGIVAVVRQKVVLQAELCYAMTINKSQGQTIPKTALYLPSPSTGLCKDIHLSPLPHNILLCSVLCIDVTLCHSRRLAFCPGHGIVLQVLQIVDQGGDIVELFEALELSGIQLRWRALLYLGPLMSNRGGWGWYGISSQTTKFN
jgi:hypothetical protein